MVPMSIVGADLLPRCRAERDQSIEVPFTDRLIIDQRALVLDRDLAATAEGVMDRTVARGCQQ